MGSGIPSRPTQVAPLQFFTGPKGAQLARLFDCLPQAQVWVKDRRGRYIWANQAFLKNYAINERLPFARLDQIRGKTDYDLCPRYLADQYRSDDRQVLAGESVVNRVELISDGTGLANWGVTNKIPVRNSRGSVVATAGITSTLAEQDPVLAPGTHFAEVLNYLRSHCQEKISNRQLARLAGLSVRAFERRFLAVFEASPQKYLRKLRLRKASQALVSGRQSIAEVAASCGFSDQSHLTREFRRCYKKTPREFRAWHRVAPLA